MEGAMRVAVFTGSSPGSVPAFAESARELGAGLAAAGVGIVYGGAHVGLMGVVADAALAAGGEVIGIIPQDLVDREIAHSGLTRLEVVRDMHERKARMAELADAFCALPGGTGTLEELFEVWTWQQLGLHAKPLALLDSEGFWAPLLALVDAQVSGGFVRPADRDALLVARSAAELLERLAAWRPPAPKGAPVDR
jgi:uncharacterized protein (TIGR00730 family)